MGGLFGVVLFVFCLETTALSKDPQMTGLPELTKEELEWQNKHMKRVKKVKLNKLGLKRLNNWRKKKSLRGLTEEEVGVVPIGEEVEGVIGEPEAMQSEDSSFSGSPKGGLPPYVDNSMLNYFPPIRSQGSLPSCGVFSGTYYTMTHMFALARDLDAKNGGDDLRFSPKWTYNMVNGGEKNGSWYYWAYEIGQKHGVATWFEFPYDGDYRAWSLDPIVWRDAIDRRFDQYGYVTDTHLDTGMEQIKQMLLNGYVLNIPTYIYSWQYKLIGDDPGTTEDDAFVGKSCCYWVNGTQGYHAMTVVGYSDHIWVDINTNGVIDPGEKGAFRIANSWGTGWKESGFCWMAYDALKNPSSVAGGPSTNRVYGWSPSRAHWVTALADYVPMLVAEFTVNHLKRNQLRVMLGVSDTGSSAPETIWYPEMISFQGGPYAFNGTSAACDGTFVFDFTDIAPSGGEQKSYYLGVHDSTTGDTATVKAYKIIDIANGNIESVCYDLPQWADSNQIQPYVDYYFHDGNILPVADASAFPLSGQAPLTVTFSGASSNDPDGDIVSYAWDFGDGASGSGMTTEHIYEMPGDYTATLTVVDNMGGSDEDSVVVSVQQDPNKTAHVEDILMALVPVPGGTSAQARIKVSDLLDSPVWNATVTGEWSGLVNGTVSGITLSDGSVTFTSRKTKKNGTITFTVTNVSATGFQYDSSQNTETEDSISTNESTNRDPMAVINASPTAGIVPMTVEFDGSGSFDEDGDVVSYEWDFGDGGKAEGPWVSHEYLNPGTYGAILTVTDNEGATGSSTINITATSDPLPVMYVGDIHMATFAVPGGNETEAEVLILDFGGDPVANATVTVQWSGLTSGTETGVTGANGSVSFISKKSNKSGAFILTVTHVASDGFIYDPNENEETSDSIQNPS
jgi:PKD repeat protein